MGVPTLAALAEAAEMSIHGVHTADDDGIVFDASRYSPPAVTRTTTTTPASVKETPDAHEVIDA